MCIYVTLFTWNIFTLSRRKLHLDIFDKNAITKAFFIADFLRFVDHNEILKKVFNPC